MYSLLISKQDVRGDDVVPVSQTNLFAFFEFFFLTYLAKELSLLSLISNALTMMLERDIFLNTDN